MSVGALIATPAFLGPQYDYILEEFFTRRADPDFYTVGPVSVLGGLFGSGHFANTEPARKLMEALISDAVIDKVAQEYQSGRRLYVATGNFDDDSFTLWDLGAIASSTRPDRYDYYRKVLRASIAVPGAFPPEYFKVEGVDGKYRQMHLDAGTNFVYLDGFMGGEDANVNKAFLRNNRVDVPVYVIMNTQRKKQFKGPPNGAPIDLVLRSYQRIGRFASYAALDRLWIAVNDSDNSYLQIARIPDDLVIPFDVFEFPQPGMKDLFEAGRAAARGYDFEERPVDTPLPRE